VENKLKRERGKDASFGAIGGKIINLLIYFNLPFFLSSFQLVVWCGIFSEKKILFRDFLKSNR